MCDNKKDKTCGEPNKSSFQQAEDGSILIASLLKFKKGKKDIRMKKHKSKVTSSQDGIGTTLSKTGGTDTLETGIENDFIIGELIHKKVVNKALNKKSSWKAPSMDRKGKDSTIMVSDNNGETIKDGVMVKKRRKRKKKKRNNVELDEPSRLQRRVRYLVIKMKLEQNLIDAYSGEGWKGQSREKIRPEKELIRAKKQIQMCKLGIREAVNQLDSLSKVGCIEDSVMAPDGSVSHEHIFCAKCKSNEIFPDNDIVLCDGTCNCAFHQNCLDPPLDTANIPPDNQGWFCKFCECRIEIIEAINAHLGTQFSLNSNWEDIFEEAVVTNDTLLLNPEDEWPSDDSADDDYDPERQNSTSSAGTDDNTSTPSSLSWSLDGEGFSGSRCQIEGIDLKNSYVLESDDASEGEIIFDHRQRRAVDYKKLYDEMFGKDAAGLEQFSDDEDWGPGKRRRREKEADAASTLITLGASKRKSDKDQANVQKKIQSDTQSRNPSSRIPASAVEKLREIFAENELPSRTTRENISKELGLEPGKVNKWFKNARYLALKSRKQAGTTEGQENASPKLSREDESDFMENTADDLAEGPNVEVVLALKRQKKVRKRKTSKPNSSSNNIKEQDTAGESPANCNKVIDGSEDVCLKKLLKAKRKKRKKPVSPISSMAEAEMERLCKAKNRIQNLRFMLLRLENGRKKNNDNQLEEPIVYVPVAELREKV